MLLPIVSGDWPRGGVYPEQGDHETPCRETLGWDLNSRPFCCKATVLGENVMAAWPDDQVHHPWQHS
ncbi:hypothetical protein CHARACLAT_001506 [Characodon lateralis]|uniref:Uncharacterized protein n=1 Tax=Characodon lateralis TaxID=208331 RepID=A0ABU7EZC6_9TELE|nr:hypothetical protein [Characodon lateralis]